MDAAESVERYHAAYANLRFALQRVKAALESVREHQLRAGYLPGDTLEKLQQSRFRYYQASLDLIDAEVLFLQSQAALLHLAPGGCEGEPSDAAPAALTQSVIANDPVNPDWLSWPKPLPLAARIRSGSVRAPTDAPAPGVGPVHPTAAYHWETTSWLDGSSTWEEVRQRLAEQGVGRVLLGLDGAQIRWVQTPEGGRALRQLLESARSSGIRVELLLGEPTWILEGPREELLAIVQQLREFSFDGLHLDLEPDQLDTKRYSREYLLGELAHTLQAVRRVSAWPMGISIHPRYFEPGRFKLCLRCALETMQLSEVVLMVYVSDPLKAARRVRPILKATPNVRFSVAVSVEPELDPSESYAGRGRAALGQALERLKRELSSPNFLAVVVQSWRYLEGMKP